MPSPDLFEYIDLDLVDRDPQDLFEDAIINARSTFPEWQPREGNIEVVLLEVLAEMVAESVFAINRLPSAITEVLVSFYGIERDLGVRPTVDLRFQMSGTQGYSIPADTSVTIDLGDGTDPITFTTNDELVIPNGQSSGVITATGDLYTSDYNGMPAETTVEVNEMLIYVDYVKTNTAVVGGRDPEDDETYLTRAVQRFQRLSTTLVLPKHFTAAALEYSFVTRAFTLDNYNPASDGDNNGPVGNDTGHVTVAVYGDGTNVSSPDKATLLAFLEENSMAALIVHLINPTITSVAVTASIVIDEDADIVDVTQQVTENLQEYLNTETWNWSTTVRRNALISIITNTPGVDFVSTLTAPASDVTLTGVAPLASAGTITISQA